MYKLLGLKTIKDVKLQKKVEIFWMVLNLWMKIVQLIWKLIALYLLSLFEHFAEVQFFPTQCMCNKKTDNHENPINSPVLS